MESSLVKHHETYVIFDWYISAKDHERQRGAGEGSTRYQLSHNAPLPGREAIMKDNNNKWDLAQLLSTYELDHNIELVSKRESSAQHDEAYVTLISYMLQAAQGGAGTIRILSDDTDVFVLLVLVLESFHYEQHSNDEVGWSCS
jgi:hypothetical protein